MFGYKNSKALKSVMSRDGYSWNGLENSFKSKIVEDKSKIYAPPAATLIGKIVNNLSSNDGNLKDTLGITSFKTVAQLAEYMKIHNYNWDNSIKNYVQVSTINYNLEQEENKKSNENVTRPNEKVQFNQNQNDHDTLDNEKMLNFIINNKDQIKGLLEENCGANNMPRYCVAGRNITKSLYMIDTVSDLIAKFSIEKHITQREMASIAFIEFFKKYGYEQKIKNIFR
ncbi:hypothetical protein KPL44_21290 [Clostridium sp. DSM 17811]|nr:hypothetical protein [Clostridium sp. DSM 17811]MBU3101789.1 hypothetical protein [Clostridium sp. DSM 17811]